MKYYALHQFLDVVFFFDVVNLQLFSPSKGMVFQLNKGPIIWADPPDTPPPLPQIFHGL